MSGLAGSLRETVSIGRRSAVRDALGGAAGGWSHVTAVRAAVTPVGDGAAVAGDALAGGTRWRLVVRAGVAVAVGDRIVRLGGQRLIVMRVTDDPRTPDRREIEAEERR